VQVSRGRDFIEGRDKGIVVSVAKTNEMKEVVVLFGSNRMDTGETGRVTNSEEQKDGRSTWSVVWWGLT